MVFGKRWKQRAIRREPVRLAMMNWRIKKESELESETVLFEKKRSERKRQ